MRNFFLIAPLISLVFFLLFKVKSLVLVVGSNVISIKTLLYAMLVMLILNSLSVYFFRFKSLFIINNLIALYSIVIISALFFLAVVYLLYYLPDSFFYQPRRYISSSVDDLTEKGVRMLYPVAFNVFLIIFFSINFLTMLYIYLSLGTQKVE